MSPTLQRRLRLTLWVGLLALLSLSQLLFWQDSTDPFAPVEWYVIKVLAPLCLVPWLLSAGADWKRIFVAWPARLVAAWAAWLWVCAGFSPYPTEGLKTAMEYSLAAVAFFLPALATDKQRRFLLAAFFTASVLAGLYGLAQHFNVDPWKWSTEFAGRPLGTIGNPNFFGGHLVLAWGLGLAWVLTGPRGHRVLPWAVFLALTLVQIYSRTVGVWLGMAGTAAFACLWVVLPAGAWVRERRGRSLRQVWLLLGGGALVAGLLWVSPASAGLLGKLKNEKSVSVTNRTLMWKTAVDLWKTAPVQGAGLASYRPQYPKLQAHILETEKDRGWNYVVTWLPHENFLYLLSETGVIGLLLFVGAWVSASRQGWRRAAAGDRTAFAALLATVGMVGVSLLNTFSNIPPTALGFFFLLGLMAWPSQKEADAPFKLGSPLKLEALAVGLILSLVVGVPAGKELVANRFTREAGRARKRDDHLAAARFNTRAADLRIANFSPQSLVGVDFEAAEDLRALGQFEPAIAAYKRDLQVNPWAPECHNMLGAALGQWGSMNRRADWVDEGAQHLRTATYLSPGYTTALLNLGGSYALLGNISGAAKAWEEALQAEPDNAQAKAYLAGLRQGRR